MESAALNNNTAIVEKQLLAYNRKDVEEWLSTYAEDAVQYSLDGTLLASGHAQMRSNIALRFQEPDLHAQLIKRMVFDDVVIDQELITRNFPEGKGTIEMLCIYHLEQGLIKHAYFKVANKVLEKA